VRRFAALRALLGDRLNLLVGMDDAIVEGVAMGATGWIAGLVNALPKESVRLYQLAMESGANAAMDLYQWFLPLLRLDTVPTFVQLIKLVQAQLDTGSEQVRAPRLPVVGAEREEAMRVIQHALAHRPEL
jgi:4-hydroxy-tetrahydrodipicolinate synthase